MGRGFRGRERGGSRDPLETPSGTLFSTFSPLLLSSCFSGNKTRKEVRKRLKSAEMTNNPCTHRPAVSRATRVHTGRVHLLGTGMEYTPLGHSPGLYGRVYTPLGHPWDIPLGTLLGYTSGTLLGMYGVPLWVCTGCRSGYVRGVIASLLYRGVIASLLYRGVPPGCITGCPSWVYNGCSSYCCSSGCPSYCCSSGCPSWVYNGGCPSCCSSLGVSLPLFFTGCVPPALLLRAQDRYFLLRTVQELISELLLILNYSQHPRENSGVSHLFFSFAESVKVWFLLFLSG